jgi:hypothetical protein
VLLDELIEDLNNNFMCNLALEYCTSRGGVSTGTNVTEEMASSTRFVMLGASHAGRLASALRETGSEVADLSVPGWKISSANVESSIELLKEVLEEEWEGHGWRCLANCEKQYGWEVSYHRCTEYGGKGRV